MKKLCILFTLLLLSLGTFAQGQDQKGQTPPRPRFNKEAFRNRVQDFITKNAELTEEEAKAFFPIYNEYKDEQMAIHKRIRTLKRNPPQSNNEADYQEHIMKIAQLNIEATQLDKVYYEKLSKAISAKKFYKVLSLEDQMHRNILKNYNGRQNEKGRMPNRPPHPMK